MRDLLAIAKFLLTVFGDWYTVGTVLVDMWRLVHQWSFLLFRLSFDCLTVFNEWYTVPIVKNTQNHWCTDRHRSTKSVLTVYQLSKTVKRQWKQQKWPLMYQSSQVYQDCTNSVTIVYQSSKTVKNSQTQKMTIGVPIVTCLQSPPNTQSPRPRPPNSQSRLRIPTVLPSSEWK